jgi:hypothetical protein
MYVIGTESLVLASCLSTDDPKKVLVCGLKMYEQLDGKQYVDCYVLHKCERICNTLMEFSDTDLKRFEDCGYEFNKWWPV